MSLYFAVDSLSKLLLKQFYETTTMGFDHMMKDLFWHVWKTNACHIETCTCGPCVLKDTMNEHQVSGWSSHVKDLFGTFEKPMNAILKQVLQG